jgi:hypothetical protein
VLQAHTNEPENLVFVCKDNMILVATQHQGVIHMQLNLEAVRDHDGPEEWVGFHTVVRRSMNII